MASGSGPLLWSEIAAFSEIVGLSADDGLTLRRMSEAYLEGLALTSRLSIMPMETEG